MKINFSNDIGLRDGSGMIIVLSEEMKSVTCAQLLAQGQLGGKDHPVCLLSRLVDGALRRQLYVMLDPAGDDEQLRVSLAAAIRQIAALRLGPWKLYFDDPNLQEACVLRLVRLFCETAPLTLERFPGYRSGGEPPEPIEAEIVSGADPARVRAAAEQGRQLSDSVLLARELANMPADRLGPAEFASRVERCGRESGFETEIFTDEKLLRLGFGGLLAVGRGSPRRPLMAVMRWRGGGEAPCIGLAGKGVTFDAGGYCLKPADSIGPMKTDMAGGADVLAVIAAAARSGLPCNLVAAVPLCDNLIGPAALLPGDVIGMLSGKTVEVANTDAEGRLILADALHYLTAMPDVACAVDIATLTGACAMTFGGTCAGAMSNDPALMKRMYDAGLAVGEPVWELPSFPAYRERLSSRIADLKNVGPTKGAGAIVAGMFLREFVNGKPWVHLDIAGAALSPFERNYSCEGPTGFGVRLLFEFLRRSCGINKTEGEQ